jgi:hypothetical protein
MRCIVLRRMTKRSLTGLDLSTPSGRRVAHTSLRAEFESSPRGHPPDRAKVGSNPFMRCLAQIRPQPRTGGVPAHPERGDACHQSPNGNLTGCPIGYLLIYSTGQLRRAAGFCDLE